MRHDDDEQENSCGSDSLYVGGNPGVGGRIDAGIRIVCIDAKL